MYEFVEKIKNQNLRNGTYLWNEKIKELSYYSYNSNLNEDDFKKAKNTEIFIKVINGYFTIVNPRLQEIHKTIKYVNNKEEQLNLF